MSAPLPKGTKVRVTHTVDGFQASPGLYVVESFQAAPLFDVTNESFHARYWLARVPDDGGAYTAHPDSVVTALEVIKGGKS